MEPRRLNLSQFYELSLQPNEAMLQLIKLPLDGDWRNDINIDPMSIQSRAEFSKIMYLTIHRLSIIGGNDQFSTLKLIAIIKLSSNSQHLDLLESYLDNEVPNYH